MRLLFIILLFAVSNTSAAPCTSEVTEDFGIFFAKFSEDKSFAVNRTLYPTYIEQHKYGIENGKEAHSSIKTKVTKSTDLATPTITEILRKKNMESKVKSLTIKNAVVEVFKPDTDWLLSYHFMVRGSCWYLHHIEDHSL